MLIVLVLAPLNMTPLSGSLALNAWYPVLDHPSAYWPRRPSSQRPTFETRKSSLGTRRRGASGSGFYRDLDYLSEVCNPGFLA